MKNEEKSVYEDKLDKRSKYNLYTYYDEEDIFNSDMTPREYTDDEIRLLYVIDPYGVADYVKRRADVFGELKDRISYKDEKFELLYGRKPKYFARTMDNVWYETIYTDNLLTVVSESETLFGMHTVYDMKTVVDMVSCAISIIGLIFEMPFWKGKTIAEIVTTAVEVVSVGEAVLRGELSSYVTGSIIEKELDGTDLMWPNNFVSLYDSLLGIIDDILAEPNFYSDILNYCAYDTNYIVYVQLRNGEKYKIEDICTAINN